MEKFFGRDLSGHERIARVKVAEGSQHFPDLADIQAKPFAGGKTGDQLRARFVIHGDEAKGQTRAADSGRGDDRVLAASGDEDQRTLGVEIGRQKGRKHDLSVGDFYARVKSPEAGRGRQAPGVAPSPLRL